MSGLVTAVKLYPAGATTNSHGGVRDIDKVHAGAGAHGEDRPAALRAWRGDDPEVDIFDREAVFIETRARQPLRTGCRN
jgi:dihydroorotase